MRVDVVSSIRMAGEEKNHKGKKREIALKLELALGVQKKARLILFSSICHAGVYTGRKRTREYTKSSFRAVAEQTDARKVLESVLGVNFSAFVDFYGFSAWFLITFLIFFAMAFPINHASS